MPRIGYPITNEEQTMYGYFRTTMIALLCGAAIGLGGCGGSSGNDNNAPATTTISGTAATGAALAGTVTAVGANGKTATVALAANGTFTLTTTDLTFPVLIKADNGAGTVLYSWAAAANTTANITPLTTLALILTDLSDNLDAVFTGWSGSANVLTAGEMQIAQAQVNANLQSYFVAAALDYTNYDFLTTTFTADGSDIDAVLDGLEFGFTFTGSDLAAVVNITIAGTSTAVTIDAAIDVSSIAIGGTSNFTPAITSFTPDSGVTGTTVTITGSGFGDDPFHLAVSFANNVAATIVSVSDTQIFVTVPAGAVSGTITVTHGLSGQSATSTTDFTVTGGTTGGSDWTARTYGSSFMLNSVAYGNATFVAVGFGNTIVTSSDGITWTGRSAPDAYSYILESVIWDGAQFVLVGDVVGYAPSGTAVLIATSPDGVTWTRRSSISSTGVAETWLADVASGGGRLTAVGKNGKILSSTDSGETWGEQFNPSLSGAYIAGYNGVASSGSTRVAVGGDSAYQGFIIISTDGVNWSVSQSALTAFYPWGVEWNGSLFIAVGASNSGGSKPVLETSPDGVTWTAQTLPASIADSAGVLNHVTWDGAQFIAVGSDGGSLYVAGNRFILTSPDGVTWSLDKQWSSAGQINSLAGVAASSTQAVVVGDSLWTKP
jgi:hypothetical protein